MNNWNLNLNIDKINMVNFSKEEEQNKRKILSIIIYSICDFLVHKGITYNFQDLNRKLSILKVYSKNGMQSEYVRSADDLIQEIYMSNAEDNQSSRRLSEYDEIATLIHEVIHLFMPHNSSVDIGEKYCGFEEFYTEYFTSVICSKIGGIKFESYYKKDICGYYDKNDNEFIALLLKNVDSNTVLQSFFMNDVNLLEETIGIETLENIQQYYNYYTELVDAFNMPLRKVRKALENKVFSPQRELLNNYILKINKSINLCKKENGRVI